MMAEHEIIKMLCHILRTVNQIKQIIHTDIEIINIE